jgi:RNA polymerase sigma-70 factor, ECF subfamily
MSEATAQVIALRAQDPEAYRQVVEELGNSLFHVALRILNDPEKAHEAVQEAFLKMVRSIENFEGRSTLKTWLYRITVNEALQLKRRELPRLDDSIEELLPQYVESRLAEPRPEWIENPESITVKKELQETFNTFVHELPEPLRTTYVMRDIEQISENEICSILNISKSAVKNRAHRARLYLRKKLAEKYGD